MHTCTHPKTGNQPKQEGNTDYLMQNNEYKLSQTKLFGKKIAVFPPSTRLISMFPTKYTTFICTIEKEKSSNNINNSKNGE